MLRSLRQVSKRSAALVVASAAVSTTRPTFIVSELTANAVSAAAVFLAGVGAGAAISGPRAVAAAVGCQAAALPLLGRAAALVAARDAVAVSGAAAAAAGPLLATLARGDVALAAALSACLLPLMGVDVATYVLAPYAAGCVVNRTMSDSAFVAEAAPAAAAVALALVVGRCAASAANLCPRELAALLAVPAVGAVLLYYAAARVFKLPTAATRAVALAAPGLGGGALGLAARCVVGAALASRWRAKDVDPGLTFESRVAERAAKLRASRAYVPDGLSVEDFARVRLKEEDYQKSLDLGAWGPRFKRTAAPGLFDKAWLQGVWYGRSQRPPRDDKPPKIGRAPKLKPRK